MSGTTITFPLQVRGALALKDGVESAPCVTLYSDRRLHTDMQRVALSAEQWTPVALTVRLRNARANVSEMVQIVAKHVARARLNMTGIVRYRTKIKTTARKYAGTGAVMFATLYAQPDTAVRVPLQMLLLNDAEQQRVAPKGTVEIRADGLPLLNGSVRVPMQVAPAEVDSLLRAETSRHEARRRELRNLMMAWRELFESCPQTFPSAHDINCYIQRLQDGGVLPSIVYMMQQPPPTVDRDFFEHALNTVLRRERMTRDQLAGLAVSSLAVCNIAVQMLALWPNYAPYVPDECWAPLKDEGGGWLGLRGVMQGAAAHNELKHFAMEEFELADLYGSDDCEGLGFLIIRLCAYLLSLPRASLSPALAKVASLLEKYVPLLLLCGVTSGDLSADFAALSKFDGRMGAHMFALFVPFGRVMRMMRRCNRATHILSEPGVNYELLEAETADLPVLFGEGTGLELPLPLDLPEQKTLALPRTTVGGTDRTVAIDPPARTLDLAPLGLAISLTETTAGMAVASAQIGSRNPAFSNNSLFMTDVLQKAHADAFSYGARKFFHMTSTDKIRPHFYRLAQLAMTPWFHDNGYSLFSFLFMQRANDAAQWHVGCTFADVINEGTDRAERQVALWPETPPDQTEYAHLLAELDNMPAPPVLRPPVLTALGTNNTWDPTAMVLSPHEHGQIEAQRLQLLRAATEASIRAMLHAVENAGVAAHVGTPHLMSGCKCNYTIARELLADADSPLRREIGGMSLDKLIDVYRDVMQRTSMGPTEHKLPVVGTFALNYEQWLSRAAPLRDALTTPMRLGGPTSTVECLALPGGAHIDAEHVTAETGGMMVQLYTMLEYRQ